MKTAVYEVPCILHKEALLRVVEQGAIAAVVEAEAQAASRRYQDRDAPVRDLEAARYSADRAFRQEICEIYRETCGMLSSSATIALCQG